MNQETSTENLLQPGNPPTTSEVSDDAAERFWGERSDNPVAPSAEASEQSDTPPQDQGDTPPSADAKDGNADDDAAKTQFDATEEASGAFFPQGNVPGSSEYYAKVAESFAAKFEEYENRLKPDSDNPVDVNEALPQMVRIASEAGHAKVISDVQAITERALQNVVQKVQMSTTAMVADQMFYGENPDLADTAPVTERKAAFMGYMRMAEDNFRQKNPGQGLESSPQNKLKAMQWAASLLKKEGGSKAAKATATPAIKAAMPVQDFVPPIPLDVGGGVSSTPGGHPSGNGPVIELGKPLAEIYRNVGSALGRR